LFAILTIATGSAVVRSYNPAMRTAAAVFLYWVHQLCLCLWLGGIAILGAVAAPAVFGAAREAGATQTGMPLFDFAGTALAGAFGRFNTVVLAAGAVMLVSGLGYGLLAGMCRKRLTVRAGLVVLAYGWAAYLATQLYPKMMAARAAGDLAAFDEMHHLYSRGYSGQMVLLLGVAALTAWLHLDRSTHRNAGNAV
jgi:hypothetical protein